MSHSRAGSVDGGFVPHCAEEVFPGHPDRLADAVAEAVVDHALREDLEALVAIEVAVHRETIHVTGRVALAEMIWLLPLELLVRSVYEKAGYEGAWALERRVSHDLAIDYLSDEERAIRGFADDQNVVVGYAFGSEATGFLPPAAWLARVLREELLALRAAHADRLGPDGKLLVRLVERAGRFQWAGLVVSLHHAAGVQHEELFRLVLPAVGAACERAEAVLPGVGASWSAEKLRLNGAGDFSCGGPQGDNGLSGKKLVVDHYGPGVPIGGGALCGKDPHKVDRCGALRARQVAVRLARATGAREVLVQLGFAPGREAPEFLAARVGAEWWDGARVAREVSVPDLSILGTVRELELTSVRWTEVLRRGYFGNSRSWEA